MSAADPFIVLTQDGASKIANAKGGSGAIRMRYVRSEKMYVIDAIAPSKWTTFPVTIPSEYQALKWDGTRHEGQWMRTPTDDINLHHLVSISRPGTTLDYDRFRDLVPGVDDPGHQSGLLVTHDPNLAPEAIQAGAHEFAGWIVERAGVRPIRIEVEPKVVGLEQLTGQWPIEQLATNSVMIVGCGSIGSAAAEALAGYGVGRVLLVDPDRFLWHNMLRHTLGPESVGRRKVHALKSHLNTRWPRQTVEAHPIDVVNQAHVVRGLIKDVDLVICAADGIAPRRVVSHLSRRAGKPAIMACVLDNGAIGEILRLRPTPRFGCLLCLRAHLDELGAMDAEADQELDYGTGRVHQPMTAVPPDLHYVGTLAAKTGVATLLESLHGDHTQALPDEHAVTGLRPGNDLAPPFNVGAAGEISWASIPPPRPHCSTCSVP
ncbi:ThiF family adenylyltransferase [Paenarthrobacter sp. PH39-S1]|uniref:HesA/MoeB/ThiF family protein n=1 Tax=Paenarthrobacter sp. PH39-S1 TaxID=3046204 RepID=UPI0024B9A61E|nr:ThiF family adenylyltransferase [Paenarthrobacter sp. PH39-S1]MDJ0356627.1 ThiF family adenylyltransferase [Paenarthrobacter sp. PH39-S1]